MFKESDYVVFVLGAGASAPRNLPVMAQFMNRARRLYGTDAAGNPQIQGDYEKMFAFAKKCRDASWAFIRHWDNIEELYTQADLLRLMAKPGPQAEEAEKLCESISWCIWHVYRQFTGKQPWPQIFNKVKEAGLRPAIITTNYDLCVEASIKHAPHWHFAYPGLTPPIKGSDDTVLTELPEDVEDVALDKDFHVPLIKLHGSINWFQNRERQYAGLYSLSTSEDSQALNGFKPPRQEIRYPLKANFNDRFAEFSPAIIPPMLGKSSDLKVIRANWRAAVNVLERARQVFVIGYSFPPTDAFMLRLLTEGVANNQDLHKFVISDRSPREAWEVRLRSMFEPMFAATDLSYYNFDSKNLLGLMSGTDSFDSWLTKMWEVEQAAARR